MVMAIGTFPYNVREEEEDDGAAVVVADVPVDQQHEVGVNVVVPANSETFVPPFHLPPTTRSSSADKPVENPPSCTKTATQTPSAYDVWIQNPALKKQETGFTDVPSEGLDREHWELSGWRLRRSRRRVTFLAIMFLLGLLILIISLAVGLAQKQGGGAANLSADQAFPIVPAPCDLDMNIEHSVVLESDSSLERGIFVHSPNEQYKAGLGQNGDFMLKDRHDSIIWSTNAGRGERLFLQTDGNLILRVSSGKSIWDSETHGNAGAVLAVDDAGLLSIMSKEGTKIWLNGIPRGVYDRPTSPGLTFPTRGIFYYPWFPATFYVNGKPIKFESDLGRYSSSDADVAKAHIDAMDYARINLSIASWWGPDTHLDRARVTMLMDETISMGSPLKWTVYHEDSQDHPSAASIRTDLEYLKKWFAWHPTWAHVDGRPVIFAYNEDGCDVINRWMDASNGEWYVVLKLFPKFKDCDRQPDHWHQYGVNEGKPLQYDDIMFSVSPGFWRADHNDPKTPRVGRRAWCDNVEAMAESDEPWHLVVTFNEAGEGTNIEPSPHWASSSGYGYYLDCLHDFPTKERGPQVRTRISDYDRNRTLTVVTSPIEVSSNHT